jgi:uncharacterized protein (TIGR04255 family)
MANPTPRPDYDNPPVVETVLSAEFAPVTQWQVPHFGLFWHQIRHDYPQCEVKPALSSTVEEFEIPQPKDGDPLLQLLDQPPIRCWFVADTTLVQVQNDRLIYNWRKGQSTLPYPRYDTSVRPGFEKLWRQFITFLQGEAIQPPQVVQCEVTYVNHLPRGEGWHSFNDLAAVFPWWSGVKSNAFLPAPEAIRWNISFIMPEKLGRLRVSLVPGVRRSDGREILQLSLTARGNPENSTIEGVLSWFDLGRDWIVRGFTDMTSPDMHRLWQRTR